jgi:argininosuccinate lyase
MTKKLWQTTTRVNELIEAYTSGEDVMLDVHLIEFDICASLAHAQMLAKQGLIEIKDLEQITLGLHLILNQFKNQELTMTLGDEDIHTKVENELTKLYPEAGAKLHTGRSRNDQVLTDLRLYIKHQLGLISQATLKLIETFLDTATKYQNIPIAGMTHMQPAMLSSFGLWLGSFAESLLDDLELLQTAMKLNNQSPLGSGAGYGVSLPLDRQMTAELLGFAKVQNNALYCQNSRGKFEAFTVHILVQVMATLNKFATDSLLFTTEPFNYISFAQELGTGSSIMPQKLNWDALELMRSKYHHVLATQLQLSSSLANVPSGYNRDIQQNKGNLISAFETTLQSLKVAQLHVESLTVNKKSVAAHIPKELFAAHWAYVLTQENSLPFRDAYRYVKNHMSEIPDFDPKLLLKQAVTQGSTGNIGLELARKRSRREP